MSYTYIGECLFRSRHRPGRVVYSLAIHRSATVEVRSDRAASAARHSGGCDRLVQPSGHDGGHAAGEECHRHAHERRRLQLLDGVPLHTR